MFSKQPLYFRMHQGLFLVLVASVLCSSSPEPDPAILHYASAPPDTFCSNQGYCVPPVICAASYLESIYDPAAPCSIAPGTPGVCCPPTTRGCTYSSLNIGFLY